MLVRLTWLMVVGDSRPTVRTTQDALQDRRRSPESGKKSCSCLMMGARRGLLFDNGHHLGVALEHREGEPAKLTSGHGSYGAI